MPPIFKLHIHADRGGNRFGRLRIEFRLPCDFAILAERIGEREAPHPGGDHLASALSVMVGDDRITAVTRNQLRLLPAEFEEAQPALRRVVHPVQICEAQKGRLAAEQLHIPVVFVRPVERNRVAERRVGDPVEPLQRLQLRRTLPDHAPPLLARKEDRTGQRRDH